MCKVNKLLAPTLFYWGAKYSGYLQRSLRQATFEDFVTKVNKRAPKCPNCGRKMTLVWYEKLSRHPPLNPTNALLNLGYVLITNEIAALLESAEFDPFIGFQHGLRYGRQSLSLDLVEEFRHPVIDGLVLTLINTCSVKNADFHKENNGAVLLNKDALKRFLTLYEERIEKHFLYRDNDTDTSYRKLLRDNRGKGQRERGVKWDT